jgi:hypothetical protein
MKKTIRIPMADFEKIINNDSETITRYKNEYENKYKKICACCGGKYIAKGRSDSKYCDKCRQNNKAAVNQYISEVKNDDILTLHLRTYKSMYARCYYRSLCSEETFLQWSVEASIKRKQYKNGELSGEEFKRWLQSTNN